MKRYCKNVKLNNTFIMSCIMECLTGKWSRNDVTKFLSDYSDLSVCEIEYLIREDKSQLMPILKHISYELEREIHERDVTFPNIVYNTRYDINSQKYREIGRESIKQQIYDYVAVNGLMELFERKIGTYQCASIPNRGQLYGKKSIERWIRKNPSKSRVAVKADIKQCYPSINTKKLKTFLRKQVKNEDLLYLTETLINSYKHGLSIGSYLSQWLCNYYLSFAYHYASQNLFKIQTRRGQTKRIRLFYKILFYMDDILIIGSRLADVKKAIQMLIDYLNNELGLTVKPDWKLFRIDYIDKNGKHHGDCIDMMGFKIYRNHTEVRRKIFLKARRTFTKVQKKLESKSQIPMILVHRCISYYGWFKNSNSKYFIKKYNINNILTLAKGRIRHESTLRNRTTTSQLVSS